MELMIVTEVVEDDKELVEGNLLVVILVEELVETEEKDLFACIFLRYGQLQGPLMVVTTCCPSLTPLKKKR